MAPLLLLLAAQNPNFEKTIAALEEAHKQAALPEILLSIAAAYEQWPGHCKEAIETYRRFFDSCQRCSELSRGVDRFDLALERCVSSAEEEAAIRERYLVPSRKAAPRPGDATRSEVVDLLRRGRTIDRTQVNQIFVSLIEAGMDAPIDRLNAMREEAWSVLLKADADAEQVLAMVARTKDVDPPAYGKVLEALIEAERKDDQAELNAVRTRAIAILRANVSPPPKPDMVGGCPANPAYEIGFLTINTTPWSEIYVNGEKAGSTPLSRYKVIAGCATVRAVSPETGAERIANITVRPNRTTVMKFELAD